MLNADFPAETANKRPSLVDILSGPAPRSPVRAARFDASPHIILTWAYLRLLKFLLSEAKRLFQQYRPKADIDQATSLVGSKPFQDRPEPIRSLGFSMGADLKRREFIALLGAIGAWPLASHARQSMPVIGYVHPGSLGGERRQVDAFQRALNEAGYTEGRTLP